MGIMDGVTNPQDDSGSKEELSEKKKAQRLNVYGEDRLEAEKELAYSIATIEQINKELEIRENPSDITNGIPYSKAYAYNRRKAINYSPPRNKTDDRQVSMGLVHEKIVTFCGVFLKYVFKKEVVVTDKTGKKMDGMGQVLNLAMEHSYRMERFVRKMILILWEVFTQGNAFVLEDWQVRLIPMRKAQMKNEEGEWVDVDEDNMDYSYEFLETLRYVDVDPIQERKAVSVLLDGRQVIFGDPEVEDLQDQKDITVEFEFPRATAHQLFGSLERWKHVPTERDELTLFTDGKGSTLFDSVRLKDTNKTVFGHLRFSRVTNRYNIWLNGVMMLPRDTMMSIYHPRMNFPISNVCGERIKGSIYCSAVPSKTKFNADFMDWAIKGVAEAFEQGLYPSTLSKGKFTLNRDMFRAGQNTHGIRKDDYEFANPERAKGGIKPTEFSFVQMLKEMFEAQTSSGTSSGEVDAQATATAIATADAKTMDKLGYLLDGLSMGFMDMALRRIETIECKYTTKQRKTLVNQEEVDVYQNFIVDLDGFENHVMMSPEIGTPQFKDKEQGLKDTLFNRSFNDKKQGKKSKYYFANPDTIRKGDYFVDVIMKPEQRKSNQLQMISFFDEIKNVKELFPTTIKDEVLQQEYLEVSGRPAEMFGTEDMKRLEELQQGAKPQDGFHKPTVKPNQQAQQTSR